MEINFTLIGEMITFIILVFVTLKFVWPPIMKAIEERQKQISDGLAAGERGHHSLELARQQAKKIISQAKDESQTLLVHARQQGNSIVEQSKVQAKSEGERLLQLAQADIQKEKFTLQHEVRTQAVELALALADKFLSAHADNVANKQLLTQLVESIPDLTATHATNIAAPANSSGATSEGQA